MHNSFILQQYISYTTLLNMFRAARCSSSGGPIVSPQPLVSSPSVSSRTVCGWRADWQSALHPHTVWHCALSWYFEKSKINSFSIPCLPCEHIWPTHFLCGASYFVVTSWCISFHICFGWTRNIARLHVATQCISGRLLVQQQYECV